MLRLAASILALALTATGAGAFDLTEENFPARVRGQPVPVTARLAEEGLGYSVLYRAPEARGYRVQVTCRQGRFSRIVCPTPVYSASCPQARIACR